MRNDFVTALILLIVKAILYCAALFLLALLIDMVCAWTGAK